jgi:hypothetical protein
MWCARMSTNKARNTSYPTVTFPSNKAATRHSGKESGRVNGRAMLELL